MSKGTVTLKRVPNRGRFQRFRCPNFEQHPCIGKVDGSITAILPILDEKEKPTDNVIIKSIEILQSYTTKNATNNSSILNLTNNGNGEDILLYPGFQYHFAAQIVAGILFVFYLIVFVVILLNLKKLHNSFYSYVISLGLTDMSCLMIYCLELRNKDLISKEPDFWIYGFFIQLFWFSGLFNILGLTVSRFMVIMWHRNGEKFLTNRNICVSIIIIWLSAGCLAVPILFPSQRFALYDKDGRIYYWDLSRNYFLAESVISVFCIVLCMCLYFMMFLRTRLVKSNVASATTTARRRSLIEREEYKILIQSFILTICMTLCLFNDYISYFTSDMVTLYVFARVSVLLNYGINPFLYLTFSSHVRNLFRLWFIKAGNSVFKSESNNAHYNSVPLRMLSNNNDDVSCIS